MESKKVNNSPKTLEQLKQEKGETYWARLIAEERHSGEKTQKAIGSQRDFLDSGIDEK